MHTLAEQMALGVQHSATVHTAAAQTGRGDLGVVPVVHKEAVQVGLVGAHPALADFDEATEGSDVVFNKGVRPGFHTQQGSPNSTPFV